MFADDPTKPRDSVVFRKDYLVMLYEGEVTDHKEAMRHYGTHTNPYSLQASYGVFNSKTNSHYSRHTLSAPIIDSSLFRGVGSIVNHKPHNQTNAYFKFEKVPHTNKWLYKIIARRDMRTEW